MPHDEDDPGNVEFDWLEVELDRFRERGMQVCNKRLFVSICACTVWF